MKKKKLISTITLAFIITGCLGTTLLGCKNSSSNNNNVKVSEDDSFSWDNASVYFVITDRFYDGDKTNNNSYGRVSKDSTGSTNGTFHGGDIKGLTKKLKEGYFSNLGINAIWISPPVEQIHGFCTGGSGEFAHYGYHGYYALDWSCIDKNMGTVEDMREFVDEAHSQGIRVIMDVVMNHTGYVTLQDMVDYDFYPTKNDNKDIANWTPSSSQNWSSYHDEIIDYSGHEEEWAKWFGNDWIRAGVPGYTTGEGDILGNLSDLPDIKTEVTEDVGLPPILERKWKKDDEEKNDDWIIPSAKKYRTDLKISPCEYIEKWLSAWVEEFGIDGFRCDTAKHIDMFRWKGLKNVCSEALNTWRKNNPDKAGAKWTDDFWMTAEVYGAGLEKTEYFDNGFDSTINFKFSKNEELDKLENLYSKYAEAINTDPNFNVLSYISSHDEGLTRGKDNMINYGTKLLLAPGGIEIFYGDESNRQGFTNTITTAVDQGSRSDMNWDSLDETSLKHWQLLGQFRRKHLSIGAGEHKMISEKDPYVFSRTYKDDKVIIAVNASGDTSIDVSSIWEDGTEIQDYYTKNKCKVSNGKVKFKANENGVILLEEIK